MTNFIWDFDGTLFDTYQFISLCFQKTLKDFGIFEKLETVEHEVKISVKSAAEKYSSLFNLDAGLLEETYHKHSHELDFNFLKLFENAKEVLQEIIKSGGKNLIYTHRGKSTIDILKFYNLEHYFVEIVTSDYGFERKPSPDALLFLIEKYNLNPKQTIYIGDREIDILCGKNASVLTCFFSPENIKNKIADFNVQNFNDFKILINKE